MESKILVPVSDKDLLNRLYNDIQNRIRPLYISNKKDLHDIVKDFEEGIDAVGEIIQTDIVESGLQVTVTSDIEIKELKPFIAVTSTEQSQNINEVYSELKGFILGEHNNEE